MKNKIDIKKIKNKILALFKKKSVFKKSFQKIPRAVLADRLWKHTLIIFVFLFLLVVVSGIAFFYYIDYSTNLLLESSQSESQVSLRIDQLQNLNEKREKDLQSLSLEIVDIISPEKQLNLEDENIDPENQVTESVLYPGLESILNTPNFE